MSRCSQSSAAKGSRATQATVGEEKGKKRSGSDLAVEEVEEVEAGFDGAAAVGKRTWRLSQEHIDRIMSWDVSEFVFSTPETMDGTSFPEEIKQKFNASRAKAVTVMREHRRANREIQEWVKSELQKHGYVEIDSTSEMYAKYGVELQEQDYVEIEDQ